VSYGQKPEKMECKSVENKLIFYLEGELTDNENRWVTEHLEHCSECSAKLSYLKEALQVMQNERQMEPKPFMYTRINARMERNTKTVRRWIISPLAIASVLVVGLVIGTLVGKLTVTSPSGFEVENYDVASIFDDTKIETAEFRYLNQ
jgi:predicted anti-sigma-YlaC factor YlaD